MARADGPALAELERRLLRLISAPSGVAAALAEASGAEAAGLAWLRGDERASAEDRLDVYANAYFARLHDALREDFPALAGALAADAFHDLATAYLAACPPARPSLRDAGARLPAFLAGASAEAAFFRVRWPYAAELAELEWALVEAFDAPDGEPLRREQLADLSPEDWAALPLALHPGAAILELAWPVERLREAADAGAPLPLAELAPEPTQIYVTRHGERVHYRRVGAADAAVLRQLQRGTTFGALCEGLGDPQRAAEWLSGTYSNR